MILKNNIKISLDKFIDKALYDKSKGYYTNTNPIGHKGDFITSPNISVMFSEMITIWLISFWEKLNCPKKINIIELGAGNGEMMKVVSETLKNFPDCFDTCNLIIHEKSSYLINEQKKNLNSEKIIWVNHVEIDNSFPCIYLANEFFDALPIKQFFKKENNWQERYVNLKTYQKAEFNDKEVDIKIIEQELKFEISKNQEIIEYSPEAFKYLEKICKIIQKRDGGLLIIDYGYLDSKIKNTIQAIKDHKFSNILEDIGDSDITYNLNFNLFANYIHQFEKLDHLITNQKKFLTSMGILQRAEIVSNNIAFSQKTDLFYRIRRLIDDKQMGELFKVMLIKVKNNKFKTGFQID